MTRNQAKIVCAELALELEKHMKDLYGVVIEKQNNLENTVKSMNETIEILAELKKTENETRFEEVAASIRERNSEQ